MHPWFLGADRLNINYEEELIMKKLLSLALALCMLMSISAVLAEENPTFTVACNR